MLNSQTPEEKLAEARALVATHDGPIFEGIATLGSLKPLAMEYALLRKEGNALGENIDTMAFMNEVGELGWIVMEVREMVMDTGMVNDKQEPIKKVVLVLLSRRPVYTEAEQTI